MYRTRFKNHNVAIEELDYLIPLTKSEIRLHYPSGICSSSPKSDWRYLSTSGTTDRLSVISDFQKRDYRRSCEFHALIIANGASIAVETIEIPPNACNVVCGIADRDPVTFKEFLKQSIRNNSLFNQQGLINLRGVIERQWVLRKQTLVPIEPGIDSAFLRTLDHHLDVIARIGPRILRAYPLYLMWLADRAKQLCMRFPSIQCIIPYGGLASPKMINRIETGFRPAFRNVYGTSELGIIAASCGQSEGMHVFDDLFLARVEQVLPHESNGLLLLTDLSNTVMPLINYQVGDVGTLEYDACPCGRKSPRLHIQGRLQECLISDNQLITASQIADCMFEDMAIANGRVDEVSSGCFEAYIVAMPGSEYKPDLDAWERRFRKLLGNRLKRLKSRLIPYIVPESSGKYLMHRPLANRSKLMFTA